MPRSALAADLATTTASDLLELCCTAPSSITTSRITERAHSGDDLSEATPAIAAEMAAAFDPWPGAHLVDTSGSLDDAVADALRAVGATEPPPSDKPNGSGSDD